MIGGSVDRLPSSRSVAGLNAANAASCAHAGAQIGLRAESLEAARHMGCKVCIASTQYSCGVQRHAPADRHSMRATGLQASLPQSFAHAAIRAMGEDGRDEFARTVRPHDGTD